MKATVDGTIEATVRLIKVNRRPRRSIVLETEDGKRTTVHEGEPIHITGKFDFSNNG